MDLTVSNFNKKQFRWYSWKTIQVAQSFYTNLHVRFAKNDNTSKQRKEITQK